VPSSNAPGERAWPTQPFNTVIPPLSPQRLSADDAWGPTDADRAACRAEIASLRNEGPFTPPSLEGTLVVPSNVGGAHWGGLAVDSSRGIAVIPVNRLAAMVQLIPLDRFDPAEARRESSRLDYEYTRMRGTPFYMRRRILTSPSGLPCTAPPFGSLVAIDLATGARRWDVPLGAIPSPVAGSPGYPGSPNLGGPIVTASGLVFIAATFDRAMRAYDIDTGRELWTGDLPAGARATPMTYEWKGRQYVVVSAGGGDDWGRGDSVVAFALPVVPPA
jgi:quinoprotein glucose dehydrogenase